MKKYLGFVAAAVLAFSQLEGIAAEFIEGTVKGERFQGGIINGDHYTFVVETPTEFKTFYCGNNAARLDSMINPGDKVKIELRNDNFMIQKSSEKEYRIKIEQVKEINGKKV